MKEMKIAILGTVGVPANYGGFETLAENLVKYHDASSLSHQLTVYCSSRNYPSRERSFLSAQLKYVPLSPNGAQSIPYDIVSLFSAVWNRSDVILLLGVSGAIALPLVRLFSSARIITNIDGIEWRREKWQGLAKRFLRFSEKMAVRFSHEVIADNWVIAEYVKCTYGVVSHVIAYGGDHAVAVEVAVDNELSASNKRYFWYMKRAADIAVSCVGLCLALPLFPLIALLIKLDSRGPVFYSQQRMGRGSKPFWVWKLRTMADGADCNNIHWTLDNDDRITRVGRIVRKTRLDEVPQLLNIFKGEMSLIGPRPEALSLVEMYTKAISYYPERHMVTPGITGWAQINYRYGNSVEDTRQKLMYDFYYIKNRCMILDIMIFLRTIMIMLTGKGSM